MICIFFPVLKLKLYFLPGSCFKFWEDIRVGNISFLEAFPYLGRDSGSDLSHLNSCSHYAFWRFCQLYGWGFMAFLSLQLYGAFGWREMPTAFLRPHFSFLSDWIVFGLCLVYAHGCLRDSFNSLICKRIGGLCFKSILAPILFYF